MGAINIKEIRKLRHMTQKELADAIGVDFTVISRYESGKITPPVDRLEAIAQALKVDTGVLLGETSVDIDEHESAAEMEFQVRSKDRYYIRNTFLSKFIVEQAKGKCDLCEEQPFLELHNGERLLEAHYLEWLSKGGEDRIGNIVALCPNCHQRLHAFSLDEDIEKLKLKAKKREETLKLLSE